MGHSVSLKSESLESSPFITITGWKNLLLYYGNFAILGERAKEFTWHTSCSNRVTDRTLQSQNFLNELKRECPGCTTAHRQEWGLFLLECLLHNVASMRRKEYWRCSQRLSVEAAKEMALEHPSMRTLIGATDDTILQVAEQVYQGEWTLAPISPIDSMTVWGSYSRN